MVRTLSTPTRARAALGVILALLSPTTAASVQGQQLDPTADLMRRLTEAPGPSAFE